MRRWICHLVARLRIHSPDCEYCNDQKMCWGEIRERLEELNRPTEPRSLKKGDLGEAVGARDSKQPKW
jgi:hypothetical protein